MNFIFENDILKVEVSSSGAELQSIYNKKTQIEYLWNGDADYWSKKSPVLFPIVGGLKNNEYEFEGKKYNLNRHGFARIDEFIIVVVDEKTIELVLPDSDITMQVFPFEFYFKVKYKLEKNKLFCTYKVENNDTKTMYFSVGAHPAFKVPLVDNTSFNDWQIEFKEIENCGIYPLNKEGLIELKSIPFLNNTNELPLTKELFYKDALVFKELASKEISIKSKASKHGLTMQFDDFKYFGIWSAKGANFVCLEPWLGIADNIAADGNLQNKEGIIKLEPNKAFSATWSVALF